MNPIDVSKMMELDFIEKTACEDTMSQEDKRFLKVVGDGVRFENGHYSMPLPFKGDPPLMPNNKFVALRRLINLNKRFKSDERYLELYKDFIDNLVKQGHAEEVTGCFILVNLTNSESFSTVVRRSRNIV